MAPLEIFQPEDIDHNKDKLDVIPLGKQLHFNNGLPYRCRFSYPINPKKLASRFFPLNIQRVLFPSNLIPGKYYAKLTLDGDTILVHILNSY